MPFRKGASGNPGGRPKKGDSLADLIRAEAGKDGKQKMVRRMWTLAGDPHDRPDIAIKAAEWIAKHGWPEEARTQVDVNIPLVPLFQLPNGVRPAVHPGR